jgi:hypothetical protein
VSKIWEQRTGPEHRAAHEAYPPPAQTPQVSQAIIQNVNSVLAGLASASRALSSASGSIDGAVSNSGRNRVLEGA